MIRPKKNSEANISAHLSAIVRGDRECLGSQIDHLAPNESFFAMRSPNVSLVHGGGLLPSSGHGPHSRKQKLSSNVLSTSLPASHSHVAHDCLTVSQHRENRLLPHTYFVDLPGTFRQWAILLFACDVNQPATPGPGVVTRVAVHQTS